MANGLMGAAGGFLQGFNPAFQAAQSRQDQLALQAQQAERQAQQDDIQRQLFNLQKQQAEDTRRRGQVTGLALTGGLMSGGQINPTAAANLGYDPTPYITPEIASYRTPEQIAEANRANELWKIQAKAQLDRDYDIIENKEGQQRYIVKGSDIPSGWKVSKPSKGVTVQVGPTQKPIPTEKTRLLALSTSGLNAANRAQNLMFKDGKYNKSLIRELAIPFDAAATGALGPEASELFNSLYGAVRDKLRMESGAAIPDYEVRAEMKRYVPGLFDDEKVARAKLKSLIDVLGAYKGMGGRGVVQGEPAETAPAPVAQPQPTPEPQPQPGGRPAKPEGVDLVFDFDSKEFY